MKKSALIISPNKEKDLNSWLNALKGRGFQVVLVHTLSETLFRLENEIYSVALYFEDEASDLQNEIAEGLPIRPFGATTPFMVLGPQRKPRNRSLLSSLLDQYFPIDTEADLLAEFADETHLLRREKAKRGQLGLMSFPEILYRCSSFHLNGAIVVENEQEKCIVYLEDGHVAFASSNRDENRFGEFLVQRGVITEDQYQKACSLLDQSNKRFGKILVDEGIIKSQILKTLIQSQIKHIVFNVFDWSEGEFYILFDEKSGQDETIARFDIAPLVLEGVRFKMNEKFLEGKFQPFSSIVGLALPLDKLKRSIHLDKAELDFLRLVGEGRPMEELLNLTAYSRLESLQYLYAFQLLGYLSFETAANVRPKPPEMAKDREKIFDELFAEKNGGAEKSVAPKGLKQAVPPQPPRAQPSRRWTAYVGWITGAVSVLVVSTVASILTMFHMPYSQNGPSYEQLPSRVISQPTVPAPEEAVPIGESQPEDTLADNMEVEKQLRKDLVPLPRKEETEEVSVFEEEIPEAVVEPKIEPVAPIRKIEKVQPRRVAPKPVKRRIVKRPVRLAKKVPQRKLNPFQEFYLRAERERRSGRLHLSQKYYVNAIKLRPNNHKVILRLASLYFDLDQMDKAKKLYQKVVKLDPNSAEAFLTLGTIYQLENDPERALSTFKRYMAVAPDDISNRARKLEVRRIVRDLEGRFQDLE